MKNIKTYEKYSDLDEEDSIVQDLINKAKILYDNSTEDWFDRNDLDEYLYGHTEFDESDEAHLMLFPQDLLQSVYDSLRTGSKIEAANVLKGLKEEGYNISKRN